MARRDKENDHTKSGLLRRRGQYRIQHVRMMMMIGVPSSLGPPPNGPHKNQFFQQLNLGCQSFFDIGRYLTDKYFEVPPSFGVPPPRGPPNGLPKNNF